MMSRSEELSSSKSVNCKIGPTLVSKAKLRGIWKLSTKQIKRMDISTRTSPTRIKASISRRHLLLLGLATWPSTLIRKISWLRLTSWDTYGMRHGREQTSMDVSRLTSIATALVLWINRGKSLSITTRSDLLIEAALPRQITTLKPQGR